MIKMIFGLKIASSIFASGMLVGMGLIMCNKSKNVRKSNSSKNIDSPE